MTTTSAAIEMAGLDAVAQAEPVRRGEVTAAELAGWAIERIEDLNPNLNALITPTRSVPRQGQERVDKTSWYPSGSATVTPHRSQYGLRAATRTPPASTKRPTSSVSTPPPR